MSKPPLNPTPTLSGITVDPRTLKRVIPESKRPDGTVRKEMKIRPGFTPQEDVRRFRGTKQAEMDEMQLPKGHIIGWVPPSDRTKSSTSNGAGLSKSQKKNQKRKEKRETELSNKIKDSWEDDDEDVAGTVAEAKKQSADASNANSKLAGDADSSKASAETEASGLAEKLEDLNLHDK